MGLTVYDERQPFSGQAIILPASGTGLVQAYPAATLQERIDAIYVTTDAVGAQVIRLYLSNAQDTLLGSVSIPASQGIAGTPAIDLLSALPATARDGLVLWGGDVVKVAMEASVPAGKSVWVTVVGGYL